MEPEQQEPFQFLLDAYVDTLYARTLFPLIKSGPEYSRVGYVGMFYSAGNWMQIGAMPGDNITALHECLHYINQAHTKQFVSELSRLKPAPVDIVKISKHLLSKTSGAYKPLVREMLLSYTEAHIFCVLYEVLAQCTKGKAFMTDEILPTLRRVFGERLVDFMLDEIQQPQYCPQWTGESYV